MTSRFQVTGHFETSAPNPHKMILNTTRSKVLDIHVCATRVPENSRFLIVKFQEVGWRPSTPYFMSSADIVK